MDEIRSNVEPGSVGWWVACDLPLEPTYFLSLTVAEQTARDLAVRITEFGRDARLSVRDALNHTVATQRYVAL